jgi:tRNA G18 (ribose-2'-O)-methylase SpoU
VIEIHELSDPRIAAFKSVRDRDLLREHEGAFMVEGEVPLRVLLAQTRRPVRAVLVSDAQAGKLRTLLETVRAPVYVAPPALLDGVVGFSIHRGVLALAERGAALSLESLPPGPSLVVALCGVSNHDNVGGIFRNAAAFGVDAIVIDRATCDPLYRKAVRVSVGGSIVVPFVQLGDEAELVDALVARGYALWAMSPAGDAVIGRVPPPSDARVALLFGAEGPGLQATTLARCRSARIEMRSGWDSLNVAAASAIALHWLRTGSAK